PPLRGYRDHPDRPGNGEAPAVAAAGAVSLPLRLGLSRVLDQNIAQPPRGYSDCEYFAGQSKGAYSASPFTWVPKSSRPPVEPMSVLRFTLRTPEVRPKVHLRDSQLNTANRRVSSDLGIHVGRLPLLITEGGLYRLMLRSKTQHAERFQVWVEDVVLPQIRQARSSPHSTAPEAVGRGLVPWRCPNLLVVRIHHV